MYIYTYIYKYVYIYIDLNIFIYIQINKGMLFPPTKKCAFCALIYFMYFSIYLLKSNSVHLVMLAKQFKMCISQHQGRSQRIGNSHTCPENNKIGSNLYSCHPFVQNHSKILDCCDNFEIRTLESLYINNYKPSLNCQ